MRGPTDEQRTVILGRTGSGKTFFAVNLLGYQNFDEIPWVIIDYKGDDLIGAVTRQNKLKEIQPDKKPPTKPGLYIMKPRPKLDDIALEAWLLAAWKQQDIGIYVDEGYALPQRDAFDMILTQGRSRHVPVIALYQRPVWMSRFAVAQADFFAIFEQNDKRDLKVTNSFIKDHVTSDGHVYNAYTKLPPYHCIWFDVNAATTDILKPVPGRNTILARFRERLGNNGTEHVSDQNILNGVFII